MKFKDYKYEHLDYEELSEKYKDLLNKLKSANNSTIFKNVFEEINIFRGHISSMQTICSIRHTINTADVFYDKENAYWDETMPKLERFEVEFARIMLACSFKDELSIPETYYLGLEYATKAFSPEIIEDLQIENKLTTEYGKLKSSAKIEFEGKTYNLASIEPLMNSIDREKRKNATIAFNRFYEDNEEKFDEIFDSLVKIRDKIAKKLGFNNFTELGYIRMNRFDYNEKMVANYRKQIVEDIVPLSIDLRKRQAERLGVNKLELYDLGIKFKTGNPKPHGSLDELVMAAKTMYADMSCETKEFFEMMVDNELFDLPTKENKEMGGYCTGIYDYKVPFIFANTNGTQGDVDVLTHEAGHAFQAYQTFKNVSIPEMCFPTMESAEIHSMTMEFFAHPYSHLFFKDDATKYHFFHIADCLSFLPYGCLVDHFQHEIYNKPNMSKKERKDTWRKLEKIYKPDIDYDGFPVLERGGYFYRQNHIFQSPFYYIDYTLAQVCALQFYVRMLKNDKNTWDDYLYICGLGGTKSFTQIVSDANLIVPFEDGCLKEVAKTMKEELDKINDKEL